MKRSKIFMGVATGILAVTAVFAAKASKFGNIVGYVYTTNQTQCTVFTSACNFVPTATPICRTNGAGTKVIYTSLTVIAGKKCKNALHYSAS